MPKLRMLRGDQQGGTHASWLELFFDLVFVVAVSELAKVLQSDLSPHGFLVFAALFVPIWWMWLSFAYYADLFESDSALFRIAFLAGMLGSLALAASVGNAFGSSSTGFAAANAGLQAILVALYWQAGHAAEQNLRRLCNGYVIGFAIGGALWAASLLVTGVPRYVIWLLALAVQIATPVLTYLKVPSPPAHESHLPERLGLFTLIVLGETIFAVADGAAKGHWTPQAVLVAVLAFVIAGCLWWVYFEHTDESTISRALSSTRSSLVAGFAYGYGHLLIFAGIVTAGVGSHAAIEHAGDDHLPTGVVVALTGGVGLFLVASTTVCLLAGHVMLPGLIAARYGVGCAAPIVGLTTHLASPALVAVLAVAMVTLSTYETLHSAHVARTHATT